MDSPAWLLPSALRPAQGLLRLKTLGGRGLESSGAVGLAQNARVAHIFLPPITSGPSLRVAQVR